MITLDEKDFLVNALNHYWNNANTNLQRKDLGDIERKNYEYQLKNSKRLMEKLEQLHKPDVMESVCAHDGAKWEHVKFCRKCNKGLQIVSQTAP